MQLYTNLSKSFVVSTFSTSVVTSLQNIFSTVILFWVNVPVLSEHITVLLPSVSTAGNFFTIAFFFTIFWTPNTIVDTATNPSGITATASDTAVINMFITPFPCNKPIININAHIVSAEIPSVFPNPFNLLWRGVSCFSVSLSIPAIFPTSVFIPVSTTIAFPLPYVIKLDENSIFFLSPIPTSSPSIASVSFSTGTDSPVKELSCDFKFAASIILKSADT